MLRKPPFSPYFESTQFSNKYYGLIDLICKHAINIPKSKAETPHVGITTKQPPGLYGHEDRTAHFAVLAGSD